MPLIRGEVVSVDDQGSFQVVVMKGMAGESLPRVLHHQQPGLTGHPTPGSQGVVGFLHGDRGRPVLLGIDDQKYRPTGLDPGQRALYDDKGNVIRLLGADGIKSDSGDKPHVIKASGLKIESGNGGTPRVVADGLTIESTGPVLIDAPRVEIGPASAAKFRVSTEGGLSNVLYAAL